MNEQNEFHTAHNIWYERADRVFSINYKKGALIPAGTRVVGVNVVGGGKPRIDFTWEAAGTRFTVLFQPKFHPGLTLSEFASRTLTPADLGALTDGFDDQERLCVSRGIVTAGIGKKAVLVAYGYPPEHFTPTLGADRWYYWVNRFMKKELAFDAAGRTIAGM